MWFTCFMVVLASVFGYAAGLSIEHSKDATTKRRIAVMAVIIAIFGLSGLLTGKSSRSRRLA